MKSKSMVALAAAGVAALTTLTSAAEAGRFGFGYRGPDLYRAPEAHYNSMGMYDTESFLASLKRKKRGYSDGEAVVKSKPSTTKTIVKRKPQIEPAPVATAKSKVKDPVEATGSVQTARTTKPADDTSAVKPVQASEDVSSVKTQVVKSSANVDKPAVAGATAATGKKLDCKVFVPTASMTISVPCND